MSLFPKAKPGAGQRRTRTSRLRTHAFYDSGQRSWNDEPFCEVCGQPKSGRVHDVQVDEQAGVIDGRKLGEGNDGDQ